MALIITDECINCDVCEPECPNEAIYQGRRSTRSTRASARNASGITTRPSASRSVRSIASRKIRPIRKARTKLWVKYEKLTGNPGRG
jgi:ferredoxin